MNRPTREQLPFYNRFMRLVNDENFMRDIETLRGSKEDITKETHENVEVIEMPAGEDIVNADEVPSPLHQVMMKYDLPLVMEDFIHHYVVHNEVALDKLRNGVYIVDHDAMRASGVSDDEVHNYQAWYVNDSMRGKYIEVTLAIPLHTTITQITDTIARHKQFIKDRQKEANNGKRLVRVKLSPRAVRNIKIMQLYKQGYKPRQILWELPEDMQDNLTAPDISKIIHKLKNKE